MKKNIIALLFTAFFICINISASSLSFQNDIEKETYIYSIKGTDTLQLDKYNLPTTFDGPKPCLIFVFGGGFMTGKRDSENYLNYFSYLVNKGYSVVSIDYRLGLKGIQDPAMLPMALGKSIQIAVEDLYDATSFVIENAQDWNIDTSAIVACGSSAGAITVLQGEYMICNKEELTSKLPAEFKYAGIISFAGAIFSENGDLNWQSNPAPIQIFHGDADKNVPFDKLEIMTLGFYGSKHISAQLAMLQSPYYFYQVENAAHEISGNPMTLNREEISIFLDRFVKEKQPLMINTHVKEIGKPDVDKDFGLMDFIKANTGQ